jgi:hypothetical protein
MQLRKSLTLGAVVLAAGLLCLTATAIAIPTGGTTAYIAANGSTTPAAVDIGGDFNTGDATFAGNTYGCSDGAVDGTLQAGAVNAMPDLSFYDMLLVCGTPLGDALFDMKPGCTVGVEFAGTNVHDGTIDTGVDQVPGTATMPAGCVRINAGPGGVCVAYVVGTVNAYFHEAVVSGYQALILNGTGLSVTNQNFFCFGLLTGAVTLNAIQFDVEIATGTTTGIDFRLTP